MQILAIAKCVQTSSVWCVLHHGTCRVNVDGMLADLLCSLACPLVEDLRLDGFVKHLTRCLLRLFKRSMIRRMLLHLQLSSQVLPLKILVKNKAMFQGKEMMKLSINHVKLMKNLVGSVREADVRRLGLCVMPQLPLLSEAWVWPEQLHQNSN